MRRVVLLFVSAAFALTASGRAQELGTEQQATAALSLARVLPAVGSTPGAAGSFFKTALQVFNYGSGTLFGRLVYHASGIQGGVNDPGLDFSVQSQQTLAFDDVLPAMGLSGLGTIDVMLPSASGSPAVIVTRVFNDADAAGTSGFTQEAIGLNENTPGGRVLGNGKTGYLVLPSDLESFRFNIGIRTLTGSSTVDFTVRDATGLVVGSTTQVMPASSFLQQEAGALLGVDLPPNGSIRIEIHGGGTVVYGATTDNTTNDPSIQFARSTS